MGKLKSGKERDLFRLCVREKMLRKYSEKMNVKKKEASHAR